MGTWPPPDPYGRGLAPALAVDPHAPRPTSKKAVTALVLGILGIVGGFVLVPLLLAVLAIVLASLTFQEMDADGRAGRRPPDGRGLATAGMVCGICALGLWGVVLVVAAITGAGSS